MNTPVWAYIIAGCFGAMILVGLAYNVWTFFKKSAEKGKMFALINILIWIGCLFIAGAISTLLQMAGVGLGGISTIILYGICIFVADKWCRSRTSKRELSEQEQEEL